MQPTDLLSKGLDSDISFVHQRFMAAMERRLPSMSLEQKERYFALLASLVGKLETPEKSLRNVLQEMMSESATLILQELNAR